MLVSAIVAGLLAGLLAGGHIDNLARVARLRWIGLLFTALVVRLGTEAALRWGVPEVSAYRLPLFALAFGLLAFVLWRNRARPGMAVALGGTLANATAILVNGGYMPVWKPALDVAGIPVSELSSAYHLVLTADIGSLEFLRHAGPLADVIPIAIPLPFLQNVASVGDLFIDAGIALFLFATLVARPEGREPGLEPEPEGGVVVVRTGQAITLGRPMVLGGAVAGVSTTPTSAAYGPAKLVPAGAPSGGLLAAAAIPAVAPPIAVPTVAPRPRHPYVRLALNADFSALWLGQLVSLFGARGHHPAPRARGRRARARPPRGRGRLPRRARRRVALPARRAGALRQHPRLDGRAALDRGDHRAHRRLRAGRPRRAVHRLPGQLRRPGRGDRAGQPPGRVRHGPRHRARPAGPAHRRRLRRHGPLHRAPRGDRQRPRRGGAHARDGRR